MEYAYKKQLADIFRGFFGETPTIVFTGHIVRGFIIYIRTVASDMEVMCLSLEKAGWSLERLQENVRINEGIEKRLWQEISSCIKKKEEDLKGEKQIAIAEVVWGIKDRPFIPPGTTSPTKRLLLANRGITPEEEATFLSIKDAHKSYSLPDGGKAVEIIMRAIHRNIPITVYGDYDADGITSTALIVEALRNCGVESDYYINSRNEGYSITEKGIREIAERGTPRLIITVDNGIKANKEIELARQLGMGVIVTDHHQRGELLPNANAIVTPPEEVPLAGVGVAYCIARDLCQSMQKSVGSLEDLAAIGTVGDVVNLKNAVNRSLVIAGLEQANSNARPIVQALKEKFKLARVKSRDLGFKFAPALNALSRMDYDPRIGVEALLAGTDKAEEYAEKLVSCNEARKKITDKKEFELILQKHAKALQSVPIIIKDDIPEGIAGIVANKLAEKFNLPSIVVNKESGRGSGRSVEGIDLYEAISNAQGLKQYGGHKMAVGIEVKNLEEFKQSVKIDMDKIKPKTIQADALLKRVCPETVEAIDSLEPYGEGFPAPLFLYQATLKYANSIRNQHLKFIDENETECIVWNGYPSWTGIKGEQSVLLLGCPARSDYNGSYQFLAQEFRMS